MSEIRVMTSIIKFLFISGFGVAILIYLLYSKFWLNFNEPLNVTDVNELSKGAVVTFDTEIKDTFFTLSNSKGETSYYFFEGNINDSTVIIFVHRNFLRQISNDQNLDNYTVVAKVLLPEKEAIDHFGSDLYYVNLLRSDYKDDTISLIIFGFVLIGLGLIIPITLMKNRHKR